MVILLSKVFGH